MSVIIALLVPC